MKQPWKPVLGLVLLVCLVTAFILVVADRSKTDGDGDGPLGIPLESGSAARTSAPAVPPAGSRHVHMGDSYAAGTGPLNLVSGVPIPCQRTTDNSGRQLAERMQWTITDVSCASAKTENLTVEQYFGAGPQLDALNVDTDVVTVVLGANDEDFFDTLVTKCANLGLQDPTGAPCADTYREMFTASLESATGPNLAQAFAEIAQRAPNATVYAAGYSWLTPATGDCRPTLRFADGDIEFAREMQTLLNAQVKAGVEKSGGVYVDMAERSEGHDACASTQKRWIEPAFDTSGEPTGLAANHPNDRGHTAMADAFEAAIRARR